MIDTAMQAHGYFNAAEAASMAAAFRDVIVALRETRTAPRIREDRIGEIICRLAADRFPLRAKDGGFDRRALAIEATYQFLASSKSSSAKELNRLAG